MRAAALTDIGRVRKSNQDVVFSSTKPIGALPNLFLVADGMGGQQAGGYCSGMLKQCLISEVEASVGIPPIKTFGTAVETVNRKLYEEARTHAELSGMGSTLTAAFLDGDVLHVFNVGDSRLYVLEKQGTLRQITRDHSYVEELVSAGRLERGSQEYNRNKNIITRAVGIGVRVDLDAFELSAGDLSAFLLCTDGLTNMLSDEEIAQTIRENTDPEQVVRRLVEKANQRGGRDNISAIVVFPFGEEASA